MLFTEGPKNKSQGKARKGQVYLSLYHKGEFILIFNDFVALNVKDDELE